MSFAAHAQQLNSNSTAEDSTRNEATPEKNVDAANTNPLVQKAKPTEPWESESDGKTAGPDIYLLPDKNGKLRQVLGFRYEEFQRAWQQQNNHQQVSPPPYTLGALHVSGTAEQLLAKLQIDLEIFSRVKGWVGVPVQIPNLIIEQWKLEKQSDEECLVFDTKQRSYVLWIQGEPNTRRRLTVHGSIKLTQGPASPELEISLPHAASSQFILQVPEANAQFETSPGIDLTTRPTEAEGTEVRLSGQTSPLRLRWGSQNDRKQALNAVVEATGNIMVHVDRYRVHYDAVLKINSYGKPLDRLSVLLPTGTTLTRESLAKDYRFVERDGQKGIVEIQLPEPRSEPWDLHLTASRQRDEDEATLDESLCSVSGFHVLEAFRQSGTVKLSIDDQLQAYFDLHQDIEQVPTDDEQQSPSSRSTIAQFDYARIPWTLDVHTVARKQRVSVKPKYHLIISQDQAELRLNFDYQFAGAYTPAVRIKMHGWEITDDEIESGGVVNLDRIEAKQQGLLVLPIKNPKAERVPISLVARRDIQLGYLELPLPESLYTFVLPGQLTVETEPSLRITRSTRGTRGISIASETSQANLLANNDTDQNRAIRKDVLELRTFLADAVLVADIAQREREVFVDINTKVHIDQEQSTVLQQMQYDVKYQPMAQIQLHIPEPLWANDSLQVRLDGEEVPIGLGIFSKEFPIERGNQPTTNPAGSFTAANGEPSTAKIRALIVSLPRPMQGKFLLEIAYEESHPELATEALTPMALPLIVPENSVGVNAISVLSEKPILTTLNQTADRGRWNPVQGEVTPKSEEELLLLDGSGKPTSVPLLMQIESKEETELATLEFAWLQTWIVDQLQQDRAVFRFHTSQRTVYAQLPTDMLSPAVELLLDGVPAEFQLSDTNRVSVAIPENKASFSHSLEIRYQRNVKLASGDRLATILPQLDSRKTSAPVFWQLVLPANWHVIDSPKQLSGEFWLGWKNFRWGRHPIYNQPDLERLTRVTPAPPPTSSNQYLFRGFEIPGEVRVLVVRRAWLVLTMTLVAFGIGMLLIYTPLFRQKLFWLVLALTLAGSVVVAPTWAMLAVQAIFWAGLMTVAAAVLRRLFSEVPQPYLILDTDLESASTAVTASWDPEPVSKGTTQESHTTPMQTGGSAS